MSVNFGPGFHVAGGQGGAQHGGTIMMAHGASGLTTGSGSRARWSGTTESWAEVGGPPFGLRAGSYPGVIGLRKAFCSRRPTVSHRATSGRSTRPEIGTTVATSRAV